MTTVTYDDSHLNKVFLSNNVDYDIYTNNNIAIQKKTASNPIDVSGNTNASSKIKVNGLDLVPRGIITIWSGTIANIPSGWALCNGSDGTPDLRNRFIIGATQDLLNTAMTDITGTSTITGGTKDAIIPAHTHTGITSMNGSHVHRYYIMQYWGDYGGHLNGGAGTARDDPVQTTAEGLHTHTSTTSTDGDLETGTNLNLPPYLALAYIMKL